MPRSRERKSHPAPEVKPVAAADVLPLRQLILRPGKPLAECVFGGDDAVDTGHFGVFVSGRLVGIASICREASPGPANRDAWRLRGMAVAAEHRRQGLGGLLVHACLEHTRRHGATLVWCYARTAAVGLYRQAGFRTVGDEFVIPDVGPHYVMTLARAGQT